MAEPQPKPSKRSGGAVVNGISAAATSEGKEVEEPIDVRLNDFDVLNEMIGYHNWNGVFPFIDEDNMHKFSLPYIQAGIGNSSGWWKKVGELRMKFANTRDADAPTDPVTDWEFKLWKKVFGGGGGAATSTTGGDQDDR